MSIEQLERIAAIREEKRARRAAYRASKHFRNKHHVQLTPWAADALSREDYSRILHIARRAGVLISLAGQHAKGPYTAFVSGGHRAIAPTPTEAALRAFQLAGIGEAE